MADPQNIMAAENAFLSLLNQNTQKTTQINVTRSLASPTMALPQNIMAAENAFLSFLNRSTALRILPIQ
jgi:heat shock protein HslJ